MGTRLQKIGGFTLIEMMIVTTIIGILSAIAFPAYQSYVQQGRRTDGQAALLAVQVAQEKYRVSHTTYATSVTVLGLSSTSPDGHYTIAIAASPAPTGSVYKATATATGQQAGDSSCTLLVITINNQAVTREPDTCWKK